MGPRRWRPAWGALLLAFTLSGLLGCPAEDGPRPGSTPAPVDSRATPELPASEQECLPRGVTRQPVDLTDVPPTPAGVETEPCVKCGYPLWADWLDCPRCAWRREPAPAPAGH